MWSQSVFFFKNEHTLINKPIYFHVPKKSSGRIVSTVNCVYPWGVSSFSFPRIWSTEPTSWEVRLQWAAHAHTRLLRGVVVGRVFTPALSAGKNSKAQPLPTTTQSNLQGQGEKSQGRDVQLFRTLFYLYLRRDTRVWTPRGLGTGWGQTLWASDLEVTVSKSRLWEGTARGTSQAFRSGLWGRWKPGGFLTRKPRLACKAHQSGTCTCYHIWSSQQYWGRHLLIYWSISIFTKENPFLTFILIISEAPDTDKIER